MKALRPLILAAFAAMLFPACGRSADDAEMIAAIRVQLNLYPESRVQDIYKSFCQDAFGPGHLIPDASGAEAYLLQELDEYETELERGETVEPDIILVPTGADGNFYRVDLSVVLDGMVSRQDYLDAFVASANSVSPPSDEEWKATWEELKAAIRNHFADIPDAEADIAAIDSYMERGDYILHHSQVFNEEYHPHYRIISRELVDHLMQ